MSLWLKKTPYKGGTLTCKTSKDDDITGQITVWSEGVHGLSKSKAAVHANPAIVYPAIHIFIVHIYHPLLDCKEALVSTLIIVDWDNRT